MRCDCVVDKLREQRTPEQFSAFLDAAAADFTPRLSSEMESVAMACQSAR